MEYNEAHGITPTTILKSKEAIMGQTKVADSKPTAKMYDLRPEENRLAADPIIQCMTKPQLEAMITETRRKMEDAAQDLDFLQAARYRDELAELKAKVEKMEKEAV